MLNNLQRRYLADIIASLEKMEGMVFYVSTPDGEVHTNMNTPEQLCDPTTRVKHGTLTDFLQPKLEAMGVGDMVNLSAASFNPESVRSRIHQLAAVLWGVGQCSTSLDYDNDGNASITVLRVSPLVRASTLSL